MMAYNLLSAGPNGYFTIKAYPFLWLARFAAHPSMHGGGSGWCFSITNGRSDIVWRKKFPPITHKP